MNETYYVYYISPDNNFVSEKETSEYSEDKFEQITNFVKNNILLILLVAFLITIIKKL